MDRPVEPAPRQNAFTAAINSCFFLWGGYGASRDIPNINIFDYSSGAWTAKQTTGTPPPGYWNGASTSIGDIMYTYGGERSDTRDSGNLQSLDTQSLAWKLLSQEGPVKISGCSIAGVKDMIVLFGGRTKDIQPGWQGVKIKDYYYSNELHLYNLKTSEFVSLQYK